MALFISGTVVLPILVNQKSTTNKKMDLHKTTSASVVILRVVALRADGSEAVLAQPPTFSVESGPATLRPGNDDYSQIVANDNTVSSASVILVTANADLQGGVRTLTARLFLEIAPGSGIPSDEAIELILSVTDATNS